MELAFDKSNSDKLIIFLHGLMGSMDAPYRIKFAKHMNDLGYNTIRVNFSKGSQKNNIAHPDIFTSQLNELEQICTEYSNFKIGLMGACTGANVALVYASIKKVECVFTLAAFTIPEQYELKNGFYTEYIHPNSLSEIYRSYEKSINAFASEEKRSRIIKKIGLFVPPQAIEDFLKYDIINSVKKIPEETSVCFVIGKNDPLVSKELTIPLFESKKGKKEFHVIDARSHGYINPSEAEKVNVLAERFFIENL